jgi:hypothetical protein
MPFDNSPPTKTEDELVADGLAAVLAGAREILASPKHWWQGDNTGLPRITRGQSGWLNLTS